MRRFLAVLGIFILLLTASLVLTLVKEGNEQGAKFVRVKIGLMLIDAEVADTTLAQAKGLSGRVGLEENQGMFFIFKEQAIQKFWMKDMRFPLDIVWIRDNRVIGILYGIEPESNDSPKIYTSPQTVDKVLEINAGVASKFGIKVGDTVELD